MNNVDLYYFFAPITYRISCRDQFFRINGQYQIMKLSISTLLAILGWLWDGGQSGNIMFSIKSLLHVLLDKNLVAKGLSTFAQNEYSI